MKESILEQLESVPYYGEDAFSELEGIINSLLKQKEISKEEKERLDYELVKVKEWGIAKVVLFGLNFTDTVILGVENYSYINYLLGITSINPFTYNLTFNRFYSEYRNCLPSFNVYVEKGKKGDLLRKLYSKYGESLFLRDRNEDNVYFVSSKPIDYALISDMVIVAKINQEAYSENISILSRKELTKLGYYTFTITEVEAIKYDLDAIITEESILERKKELFDDFNGDVEEFDLIEEIKPYLSYTENKLVYQEQFYDIGTNVFGISKSMADYYRREIAFRRKENLYPFKDKITKKFPESGEKLLDYLYKAVPYSISKAYVIASIKYKLINS